MALLHDPAQVIAFVTFSAVAAGTPGPSNTLLTALPSCFPWLAFGAALQRYLRTPRARRVLNTAMAALLAASVILFV